MSASANTPDGRRLDELVRLFEAYEHTHFPPRPTSIVALH
jgi:hypothetical protein